MLEDRIFIDNLFQSHLYSDFVIVLKTENGLRYILSSYFQADVSREEVFPAAPWTWGHLWDHAFRPREPFARPSLRITRRGLSSGLFSNLHEGHTACSKSAVFPPPLAGTFP